MKTASKPSNTAALSSAEPEAAPRDWLIEHQKTGMLMVLVPGGKFLAGEGGGFEVELAGFYLGLHLVTNRQYEVFVRETRHRIPDKADSGEAVWKNGSYPSEKADHPVVCASWDDATAYCEWAGLRLPRELEWEKGARGTDGRKYPWGQEWDEKKCRNSKNKGTKETSGVWGYAEGTSPYGAYQMSGNVWEWCEDWYDDKAYERYRQGNLTAPSSGQYRVLRGGSWDVDNPVNFTAFDRYRGLPDDRDGNGGFRCVMSAGVSLGAGVGIP